MPEGNDDFVFDDSYQAFGYSSNFVLNEDTCCRVCLNLIRPAHGEEYDCVHPKCYCKDISVNDRDDSDYSYWIVCVLAVYKNPGPMDRTKFILHIWEGDVTKTSTLRSEVDELVAPIKYSHGMYPSAPHHTIVLEPNGFESQDHAILSRVSRNFETAGGPYRNLKTSVGNYIRCGGMLLEQHCNQSTSTSTYLNVDPICSHVAPKKKKHARK